MIEINDDLLQKVNGGSMDWKQFGQMFLDALNETDVMKLEYKELAFAIKDKRYTDVIAMVIPLLADGDELIEKIVIECM